MTTRAPNRTARGVKVILAASAAFFAPPIFAAATAPDDTDSSAVDTAAKEATPLKLEEVVVTAQKREERLQNVPISVAVLSGGQLESPTISSVSEALTTIPGVSISPDPAGTVVSIRGVSTSIATFAGPSPIAYYVDSVPFGLIRSAVAPDADPYDLQRVEVLRGPQGTLYGASALNGVVRILTNDPDLNHFDFKVRGSDSYTDGGSNNYQGDTAVNVPLIEGKLAARAVFGYENDGGWIDSPLMNRLNSREVRNYRLKINAQPMDDLSIGLSYWGNRDSWNGPSLGNDDYRNSSVLPQPITTNFDVYGLKIGYTFFGYSLSSVTSHLKYENDTNTDYTSLVGFPFQTFIADTAAITTEEVLLNSPSEGAWRWSVGGIWREGTDNNFTQQIPPLVGGYYEDSYDTSKSYAVFGEATRRFFDGRLEATAGLRQFGDHVDQLGRTDPTVSYSAANGRFHALTPRAVLTWHQTSDLTFYGSYSQGFRSGFPQDVPAASLGAPPVNADKLHNYEVGAKGDSWDGKLTFELATYYMKWKSIQEPTSVIYQNLPVTEVVNGESASGAGVDLAVTVRPLPGLTVGVNGSWNRLESDTDVYSAGVGSVLLFRKGDRFNYSPETTAGGSIAYQFPLGGGGLTGRLSAAVNYTAAQKYANNLYGSVISQTGDPITVGRAAFSIDAAAHWTATLFADNVNNERHPVIRQYTDPDFYQRIRPLTAGLQLEYHYR